MRSTQRSGVSVKDDDTVGTVELELLKLVRHLETFGRRSSLYVAVDRAGYLALRTINNLGPCSINDLAQALHLDASTVTRQVAALDSGALITRRVDPTDRRSSAIALSPDGRRVMRQVERGRRQALETMLQDWRGSEINTLATIMAKLNQALVDHADRLEA